MKNQHENGHQKKRFALVKKSLIGFGLGIGTGIGVSLGMIALNLTPDKLKPMAGLDMAATAVLIIWIIACAISIVLFILTRFNKDFGEKAGIVQLIGGGKRGQAIIFPLVLFYLGNGGLLTIMVITKASEVSAESATWMLGLGSFLGVMMIYAGYQCWRLLEDLLRGIWIDSNAITAGFVIVGAMLVTLADMVGFDVAITGYQTVAAYHALYFIVYIWITLVRAPELLTNPLAHEA